jgi:hypothetical protein
METMHFLEHLEARRLFAAGTFVSDGDALRSPTPAGQYALQDRKLVLSDGRVVVARDEQNHWRLRAYQPDGAIDKSFGDRGYLDLSRRLASGNARRITYLAEAPDGGLYVGGTGRVRNERRASATGTLVAKLKADGSLDKSFFPRGARDIDRGGFFRMDAPLGSYVFRDVLQVVRGGKLFSGMAGQSNDAMLNDGAGSNPTSAGGLNANTPVALTAAGSLTQLPALLRSANGILSLTDAPDGSLLGIYYLYVRQEGGDAQHVAGAPVAYLIRIGANGQIFAMKLGQGRGDDGTGGNLTPIGLKLGEDGKIYATAAPRPRDARDDDAKHGDSSVGEVTIESASDDGVRWSRDDAVAALPAEVSTRSAQKASEDDGRHGADENATHGPAAAAGLFRDGTALAAIDEVSGTHASAAAGGGSIFGQAAIDRHVLASAALGGGLDVLPATGGQLHRRSAGEGRADDDAATHVASPIAGAHGFAWEPIDDAPYVIRVLSNRVADITGALAVGRTIGSFAVRIPDAPLLGSVTAALREKQQKLAPNT